MDVDQAASQLLSDQAFLEGLPTEIVEILRFGSNRQYLDTLAHLALQPSYTSAVFASHHELSVELCSIWVNSANLDSNAVAIFSALARVLAVAPYLSPYVTRVVRLQRDGSLAVLASHNITSILEIPQAVIQEILLALLRLLRFDDETFAYLVSPVQLQLLLTHTHRPIRYLAIQILCLYLHASEAMLQEMVGKYLGQDEIRGQWEDKVIDYTFFSLWEEKRLNNLERDLQHATAKHASVEPQPIARRLIDHEDFSPDAVCLANVLLPCLNPQSATASGLIMTPTVKTNMQTFAEAMKRNRPIMLTGLLGAGKTSLVRAAARALGCEEQMLVLHLNEQTDAKLLIGMYTTAGGPGSFKWQPGVLTKAVADGRWVFIEDFDRAPAEIVSMILPLLERGELLVPHWGKTIRAFPGFKIIATVRSSENTRGEQVQIRRKMIGNRHWEHIHVQLPPVEELGEIVIRRSPLLHAYRRRIIGLYSQLTGTTNDWPLRDEFRRKSASPQDLFRWTSRINDLLQGIGVKSGDEPIPETTEDRIFLEAVDCFAGSLPHGAARDKVVSVIAQELHISRERVTFCRNARKPEYFKDENILRIGRASLLRRRPRDSRGPNKRIMSSTFATTNLVLRHLESVGVAIKQAEPCLLIGETGTGKTTVIQQLAELLGHKLVVVNLSQQSEAGDLLGGFKPVNIRTLAIPLKEEFEDLFDMTFSSEKNQRYVEHVAKAISKKRWSRVLTLWQEAFKMVESTFMAQRTNSQLVLEEPSKKKRKVGSQRLQLLKRRWENFESQLKAFQKHLESGSKGFAFSFVEGNLVKAVRNGDWVLLDEINLAAPDTLDSLADLLTHGSDGPPSILLTETGETERIRAHKDFRIFGAMNPANDVGKRDLPLSLRSRFFELFIDSPDRDLTNLIPVVQAYLGNIAYTDVRLANDVAQLYLDIQILAHENRLVDGADQKPHYSLRTLTRTLVYVVDIAPTYGLRRALFEGFSMSFLTLLNQASIRQVLPLMEKHLLGNHKNSRALLLQTPKLPQDAAKVVSFKQYWMPRGPLPIQTQAHYIITPFIERNLLNLVRATSTRRFPVLLQGPTSSGKTSMVEYLANISGHKFVRINNHEHTDLQEYLGTYVSKPDGQLQYQEGILVQALREGFWIVLDELNLAPTDVLEALNRLLDDNRELFIPETQQVVRPHESFMLFATQNPPGIYGGRKVLSRAFRNRFLELHFDDIPEDELEVILRERSQVAPSFCAKIVAVYKKLSLHRQHSRLFEQKNSFATLRDLFRWASRNADDREQLAINGYYLLAERVRNDEERQVVKSTIEEVMRTRIDDNAVYDMRHVSPQAVFASAAYGITWTRSMRRLYVLVTEALKNQEPILLVGETGSGKTTICQVVAAAMQNQLLVVNAHQNMETGDLIGSQRPVRSRQSIEARLYAELRKVLLELLAIEQLSGSSLQELIAAYQDLPRSILETVPSQTLKDLDGYLGHFNSLFEWADGSLVHAMKTGQHFLLDEISLADDSVLERLNSVLEPDRKLFLAEKGVNDALVVAAEGFQFLATMNPGGDYGKKELSPALRNRFTEIWAPHPLDQRELEEILEAKLGQSQIQLAKPMVAFAQWYGRNFNNAAPEISIRDLLAWVTFINTRCIPDVYLSILHGAALVYIDTLGANPSVKLHLGGASIDEQRRHCLDRLSKLFQYDMTKAYWEVATLGFETTRITIGLFGLKRSANALPDPTYNLQAPTTLRNSLKIVRALQLTRPILIEGSPGVGKTTLVAALAQACGVPLTRINLSDQTDLMDLFGSDVPVEGGRAGQFQWRDAPFLRAMQKGEWVLLDEMNLASQSVLEGLNACFDHRGQVYIAELDQTFSRHPDFVVFAAQNPHHQGSGRKGLPASFVNRFTVVYADMFTAEDLLMICSERFPTVAPEHIEVLTKCVAGLDTTIQSSRRLAMRGGPWEINLRDTTRWLDLLSSQDGLLPAAKAEDFAAMLFLQRFRTPEDAFSIASLLRQYLPHSDESRHRSYGISANHIQVGLGLLHRQPLSLYPDRNHYTLSRFHLPYVESLLLCIQKGWPCVLVGLNGSGTTKLIRHLASCAGAELVELSVSSDMDTTDLVGGYEQSDSERERAAFITRLRRKSQKLRLQRVRASKEGDNSLAELEYSLAANHASLSGIVELLRKIVDDEVDADFDQYLREGEAILQKTMHDNRARFEWVDGMLVKAVVEGKWLILENANLCSPSVLDRLNSLLEPNGVLNINERHSEDGSVQVVKPHPNFRMFMTMDPQYGELSRAMRNRNIELFIPDAQDAQMDDGVNFVFDSALTRFAQFQQVLSSVWRSPDMVDLIWIGLDHLAFSDCNLLQRWPEQIHAGLVEFSSESYHLFLSVTRLFSNLVLRHDGGIIERIRDMYVTLSRRSNLPAGFEDAQTIQPCNNPVLLDLERQTRGTNNLLRLGLALDILIDITRLEAKYESIVESTASKMSMQLSRLQQSIVSTRSGRINDESTKPLSPFIAESLRLLQVMLLRTCSPEHGKPVNSSSQQIQESDISNLKGCLSFLSDMIDVAHETSFEEAVFQVYLSLGQSMLADLHWNAIAKDLIEGMRKGLNGLTPLWQLHSGQSMDLIWSRIRPPVATTLENLEQTLLAERLAERFDALIWTSDVPLERLGQIRELITQMRVVAGVSGDDLTHSVEAITDALHDLEAQNGALQESRSPYLQPEFKALRQYQAALPGFDPSSAKCVLSLLSGESTKELVQNNVPSQGWQRFSKVTRVAGIGNAESALATSRSYFPGSVLKKMENISEVPLGSLNLLQTEVFQMASNTAQLTAAINKDQESTLLDVLKQLHFELAKAHKDYLQPCHVDDDLQPSLRSSVWQLSEDQPSSHYLRSVVQRYLQPSWELLVRGDSQYLLQDTASAWILFFSGCLQIYVPDRVHDPALKPLVIRDRHRKRVAELQTKLAALRHFEELTTGQNTNLRCQLVEKELETLGKEPAVEPVLRPQTPELGLLQGEFNNILHSILRRSPDQSSLSRLSNGDAHDHQEIELLQSNITQAASRLHQGLRTYDDITKPLVVMLRGLEAGLAMAQIAIAPRNHAAEAMEHVCQYTPFLGMQPGILVQQHPPSINRTSYDLRFKHLESVAVMDVITAATKVFKAIHRIYEDWKKQLSEDRERDLARSSMYRYRGAETDADANDDEAFHELFPDYEASDLQPEAKNDPPSDPRGLAQRIARYQRDLFEESTSNPVDRTLRLIRNSCADVARMWQHDVKSRSPIPARDLLCGLILSLDENVDRLHNVPQTSKPCDFYHDPNLIEARKLVSLVQRIQGRFLELKQAWPEHTTLDDVLGTSSDLLALRHTEPVAKLITKVEKLHGYVHEWQIVASREYSASALYEQLTSLIVDWRRLELTTWSRLFDMEDERCEEEVDSWWFVAYEAIVAAPLSILESGEDVQKHAEELFMTLQGFLIDTSMGHFWLRLRLLESFRKYVSLIEQSISGFKIVQHTLSNFLAFYSRYTAPMQQVLHSGRLALEKEIKDILILASWKDTNVNALRESAKRSHHKLFKVVRKYRALLARPAQNIIEQGFPEIRPPPPSSAVFIRTHLHQLDTSALQLLEDLSYEWSKRPARFRNISTTISNMDAKSQIHPSTTDIPSFLDHFITELSDDIKSLQKETPSTATDDNAELLKHLTSRKRKLFSDTLKIVRHMGFGTNLSADVLSRQVSAALILSRLPHVGGLLDSDMINTSEYHLHQLLNFMPTVRQASRTPSDLHGSEIARTVGYFESMLSYVVRQRMLLADFASGMATLDRTVETAHNVWKPTSYQVVPQSLGKDVVDGIKRSISRLPHIVDTGCLILEKHGKLGNMDHSNIRGRLQDWSTKFKTLAADFETEPALPHKTTYSQQRSRCVQAQELMEAFQGDLRQYIESYPALAFIFQQIMLWTETNAELANGHYDQASLSSAKDFDQRLLKTCDLVLVTIQNLERFVSAGSSTDDANWLVSSEAALANGVKALHVPEISASLEEAMAILHRLDPEDLTVATALTALALPIINQYCAICHNLLAHLATRSRALNNLAATLAKHFTLVAAQGFCNPSKPGATEAGKNEKLEEGTGLGEGEGAEDISKDIQDDEDLSELAQEGQKQREGEEIEDQDNAVNMDQDELQGELGDAPERNTDGEEASEAGSGDEEPDEETGEVDDLDPNAVDEKLWDDDQRQSEKEKQGTKAKGAGKKDDQPNAESDQKGADEENAEGKEELSEAGAEEREEIAKQEMEGMDPHAGQEENLDLPDEMDLDGQEKSSVASDVQDSDLDGLSNAGSEKDQQPDEAASVQQMDEDDGPREGQAEQTEQADAEKEQPDTDRVDEAGSPVDTEPDHEADAEEGLLQNRTDDAAVDEKNIAPSDAQGLEGHNAEETTDTQMQESNAAANTGAANQNASAEKSQAPAEDREMSNLQDRTEDASERRDRASEDYSSQAFKRLGDALERWHRQQRQIQGAQASPGPEQDAAEVDMTDREFQHLENEDAKADTQALGAATEDQAHTLDQRALDSEMQDQSQDFGLDEAEAEGNEDEDTLMEDFYIQNPDEADLQEQPKPSTFIGPNFKGRPTLDDPQSKPLSDDLDDSTVHDPLHHPRPPPPADSAHLPRSLPSAQHLWSHHTTSTRPLSLLLTEQLRLILSPTLASKMRGDFRTGKRLNIKKIIPYIASGYKRDKIWMRRSVPSKRNYQIMLAIDDSRSMADAENGAGGLAFETLALVANSLAMLEAGDLAIVSFGEDVRVAHPFGQPWSADAGVDVYRHFGFQQERTDIVRLLGKSLEMFREARAAGNAEEVWQLMFIVSDGVFEGGEGVRRLVRRAVEERVLVVFVVVDCVARPSSSSSTPGIAATGGTSIVDMNEAVFEGEGEERRLVVKRYLDGFPFGYYVVVGDVRELPGVLGQALRGWFWEVVGGGGGRG